MSLWEKIKGEFIDIIQWTDDSQDTMVYRFERYGNQIKYGAQLTVRFGKLGAAGQTQVKDLGSEAAAQREAEKLIREKTKKGYAPV